MKELYLVPRECNRFISCWFPFLSSPRAQVTQALTLRLLCSFMPSWAEFSHTFQPQRNVQKKRWRLCENPLPGADKKTEEEMNTSVPSFHPHTFTFYSPPAHPLPPSSPAHSACGHHTDNPKGHLWPPSLAPSFGEKKKMEREKKNKKPEGVSVLIFSFLAIIFFSSTSWCGELIFFIHCGEKGATDHSAAEIVRQSVTFSRGHDKNNQSILMKIVVRLNYLILLNVQASIIIMILLN